MADAMNNAERLENARKQDAQLPSPVRFHVPQVVDTQRNSKQLNDYQKNDSNNYHSERLENARKNSTSSIKEKLNTAKDFAAIATPIGAFSLVKQIDFIADMPYVAAIGAALLKDGLDLIDAETVVLPIIFGALCSIFIFMMLLLVGANEKKKNANAMLKKIGILLGGGIADVIPGLDYFPIETATVALIYVMELMDRKNSSK
ncbi:MAG: hypothetical protein WCI36_04355 [bacterium]